MMADTPWRRDGRRPDELRPLRLRTHIAPACPGSVLISMGATEVICAAGIEDGVPTWMRQQEVEGGWLTAEYSMLPYSTRPRTRRESSTGKISGRTMEIQRLIGRSLRAVLDLRAMGKRTIWLDCDVLRADGGTRTAAITGSYVALRLAVNELLEAALLETDPLRDAVAAVSVGLVDGVPLLDLDYDEDVRADVDMNVVMTGSGRFVEVQGTAEGEPFTAESLEALHRVAAAGIRRLLEDQRRALTGQM